MGHNYSLRAFSLEEAEWKEAGITPGSLAGDPKVSPGDQATACKIAQNSLSTLCFACDIELCPVAA